MLKVSLPWLAESLAMLEHQLRYARYEHQPGSTFSDDYARFALGTPWHPSFRVAVWQQPNNLCTLAATLISNVVMLFPE